MAAYHAARQSASQDLGRCVELVTTALAFDERSAFFTCALVARGAAASAPDPREPSRGSTAAVAVAAEAQPESAAAARLGEHEVLRLPTPPPVTAGKGSADGSPAASPRGIPATLETAADELPAHSLSVPAAGSVCDSELSFNDAATAPEPAAPRGVGQKCPRPKLVSELVALGQPPVGLLEGDAASRTRRSRAPPEAGLAAPQVSSPEAAPQTGDASSTSVASGASDAAATPPGARPVPASAQMALPLPQPAVPQVTDRKRLRETRDTPAAPLGARAASAATPPLPPAAAQPRRVGRSRVKDTRRRPASRGQSRASTRPTAKATRQPKKSRGEFRTGAARSFAVHLRSACCAGASGGATSGGRAASDPENSPLRPSHKVIDYWVASLSIDSGLPELHDVASLVISYVYNLEHATAGVSRARTESAFDLFMAKVSPTVTAAALLSAIKAVWSHVEPVRSRSGVTNTSLLPSRFPLVPQMVTESEEGDEDEAYARDLQAVALLVEATRLVQSVADTGICPSASRAKRLLERWTMPPCVSGASPPPGHPHFVRAADSLLALVIFLREYASDPAVWGELSDATRSKIEGLCAKCCFPVRRPISGLHASRVGQTAVHVSLLSAAKAGDERAKTCLSRLVEATYAFDAICRRARADSDINELLESIRDGGLVGDRQYFIFNGPAFAELVNAKDGKAGEVGSIVRELREAVLAAKAYTLVLMGHSEDAANLMLDAETMSILVGDGLAQLEHFDVMSVYQLLMMLTTGLPVRAAHTVDAAAGRPLEEVLQAIKFETGDTVRQDLGQEDQRPVSRYHARLYAGMSYALLRSSPRNVGAGELPSESLRCRSACGDEDAVVPAGTLVQLEPQTPHFGPGPASSLAGKDDAALKEAMAAPYRDISGLEAIVDLILRSPYPPRIIAFSIADPYGVRYSALAWVDDSNATQNRLDTVLQRLGLWRALVRFYLLARARGYGNLPAFCGRRRQAAGRALLALTPPAVAHAALAVSTLDEMVDCLPEAAAAVAAAFPAIMTGGAAGTAEAALGIQIINAVLAVMPPAPVESEDESEGDDSEDAESDDEPGVYDDKKCAGAAVAAARKLGFRVSSC